MCVHPLLLLSPLAIACTKSLEHDGRTRQSSGEREPPPHQQPTPPRTLINTCLHSLLRLSLAPSSSRFCFTTPSNPIHSLCHPLLPPPPSQLSSSDSPGCSSSPCQCCCPRGISRHPFTPAAAATPGHASRGSGGAESKGRYTSYMHTTLISFVK